MTEATKLAVQVGLLVYLAGRIPRKMSAIARSSVERLGDRHLQARDHGKSEGVKILEVVPQDTQNLFRIDARVVMHQEVSELGHLDERRRKVRVQQPFVPKNLERFCLRAGHAQSAVGNEVVGEVKARFDRQVQTSLHDALSLPGRAVRIRLEMSKLLELGQVPLQSRRFPQHELAINHGGGVERNAAVRRGGNRRMHG